MNSIEIFSKTRDTDTSAMLLLLLTNAGVTLYHDWEKYYGPKGLTPYFLKTEGSIATFMARMFGAMLIGVAINCWTAGNKDKIAMKGAMIGELLILPLMIWGAFFADAKTFNPIMWRINIPLQLLMIWLSYKTVHPTVKKSPRSRR